MDGIAVRFPLIAEANIIDGKPVGGSSSQRANTNGDVSAFADEIQRNMHGLSVSGGDFLSINRGVFSHEFYTTDDFTRQLVAGYHVGLEHIASLW